MQRRWSGHSAMRVPRARDLPPDREQWGQSVTAVLTQPEETQATLRERHQDHWQIKEPEKEFGCKTKVLAEATTRLVLAKENGTICPASGAK